ncbi:MAG: hypothetical protein EAZ91_21185 [Cytophagales bacterium]|nr:MAG: hypothetical protein EAZ91_21185 [Cytophagales bacterium]
MKLNFTFLFLLMATLQGVAQDLVDYYQPGGVVSRKEQNQLQMRFGPHLAPQWYLMSEGFVRKDVGKLDQSLGGLLTTSSVTRLGWSVGAGVTYRNKWAVEAGIAQSPVHNDARLNSRPPMSIMTRGDRGSVFVRGKWALLNTSRNWHRSGFWVTGGLWAMPNNGEQKELQTMSGYTRRGADAIDETTLISRTKASRGTTGLLELGLEYQVRVSNRIDLGAYARHNWGLSDALTTDISYYINNRYIGQTTLRAKGNGASYGLTVRYILRRPTAPSRSLYELQGNR